MWLVRVSRLGECGRVWWRSVVVKGNGEGSGVVELSEVWAGRCRDGAASGGVGEIVM